MAKPGSREDLEHQAEALAAAAVDQALEGLDLKSADTTIDEAMAGIDRIAQGGQAPPRDTPITLSAGEWASLALAAHAYREASIKLRGAVKAVSLLAALSQRGAVQLELEERMAASGLKKCPQCANFVRGDSAGCPFCGHTFSARRS
jgi:hypothetical protein